MTATRIRETADGVLYRLSEPVEYHRLGYTDTRSAEYVIATVHKGLRDNWVTSICAASPGGDWHSGDIVRSWTGLASQYDAKIEDMGYTVINGEEL